MGKKIWANVKLRNVLCELFIKHIVKECETICHEKSESILRKTKEEDFINFTFEKMDEEMIRHCPVFRDILKRASAKKIFHKIPDNKKIAEHESLSVPSVCIAASLIFKCRQSKMWALQKMLDLLEDGEKKILPRCLLEYRYIYLPPDAGLPKPPAGEGVVVEADSTNITETTYPRRSAKQVSTEITTAEGEIQVAMVVEEDDEDDVDMILE